MAKAKVATVVVNFKGVDDDCFAAMTLTRGSKVSDIVKSGRSVLLNGNAVSGDTELHNGDNVQEVTLEGKAG